MNRSRTGYHQPTLNFRHWKHFDCKIIGLDQIKSTVCFSFFAQTANDNKLFILLPEKIEKIINDIGE